MNEIKALLRRSEHFALIVVAEAQRKYAKVPQRDARLNRSASAETRISSGN